MTTATAPRTPTSQLTYDKSRRQYTGEISSTNGFDADGVMVLVSSTTGREIPFEVWSEFRDDEGDITYWILRPVGLFGQSLASVQILLFND